MDPLILVIIVVVLGGVAWLVLRVIRRRVDVPTVDVDPGWPGVEADTAIDAETDSGPRPTPGPPALLSRDALLRPRGPLDPRLWDNTPDPSDDDASGPTVIDRDSLRDPGAG